MISKLLYLKLKRKKVHHLLNNWRTQSRISDISKKQEEAVQSKPFPIWESLFQNHFKTFAARFNNGKSINSNFYPVEKT